MPGAQALERYLDRDVARAAACSARPVTRSGFSTKLYGWTTEPGPARDGDRAAAARGRRASTSSSTCPRPRLHVDGAGHQPPHSVRHLRLVRGLRRPSNFFDTLLNGRRITERFNNDLSLFDDADVNDLIERAMATRDDSTRTRIWQEVDRQVMDRAPVVPMIHIYESRLYSPRLGGWYRHVTRILKLESLYLKSRAPV